VDAAHVCYLVAGVTPTPLDAGHTARMLLLGVDHTTPGGLKSMQQLLPLMRSEVYEWARLLAGEFCIVSFPCWGRGLSYHDGLASCVRVGLLASQGCRSQGWAAEQAFKAVWLWCVCVGNGQHMLNTSPE
jgi:hypothetical protein